MSLIPHCRVFDKLDVCDMQDTVDKELVTMSRMRIIEPSTSAYASHVVIVRKTDGTELA